jgi:hypothetical protein
MLCVLQSAIMHILPHCSHRSILNFGTDKNHHITPYRIISHGKIVGANFLLAPYNHQYPMNIHTVSLLTLLLSPLPYHYSLLTQSLILLFPSVFPSLHVLLYTHSLLLSLPLPYHFPSTFSLTQYSYHFLLFIFPPPSLLLLSPACSYGSHYESCCEVVVLLRIAQHLQYRLYLRGVA